jgi:hypothetical protein
MFANRGPVAIALCLSLLMSSTYLRAGGSPPLGILTRAYEARLNSAEAYAGLSVFEGETLATSAEGKLGVRVGAATLIFSQGALATLERIEKGTHVDMAAGALYFTAPEAVFVEVHLAGAVLRPESNQATQAEVQRLGPKVIQVSAKRGNLELYYGEEFQLIPEGETYRIYLDAPAEPQKPAGAGAPNAPIKTKTVIYIVSGAAVGALTAWGIHELVESSGTPESPAKP